MPQSHGVDTPIHQNSSTQKRTLQPISATVNALTVAVDPRMELLAAVQFHSDYDSVFHLLTKHDFPYKAEIQTRFAEFKDHSVIKKLDELSGRPYVTIPPFSYGAPPEVMLNVHDGFILDERIFRNEFLVARAGGRESLLEFVGQLGAFWDEVGFAEFWEEHIPFYREIIRRTLPTIGGHDYTGELESYYGMHQKAYTILLVPLFHSGGYGPKVDGEDGSSHVFSINGPRGVVDGLPAFGTQEYFKYLQRHEFSHSFVNPITEKLGKEVDKYSGLFPKAEAYLKKRVFGEWQECLNEHIIRAITVRLATREDPAEGERVYKEEDAIGLIFLDDILERLVEFESNRDKYPTFECFYLRLVSFLDKYAAREGLVPAD